MLLAIQIVEHSGPVGTEKMNYSQRIVEGRLNNSDIFDYLTPHLSHLSEPERSDIMNLVSLFPSLFVDVRT